MKRPLVCLALLAFGEVVAQNTFEGHYTRSLSEMLDVVSRRFGVRFKYNIDTAGLRLPYADSRIRPYSVEETLHNILAPFDFKAEPQSKPGLYKIKPYESYRRTVADGRKMLDYLNTLYSDSASFEMRRTLLKREVRELLHIDTVMRYRVPLRPRLSAMRRYEGYTVQNFAIETLPGLYVCGSIYAPVVGGIHPVIVCPNGHFNDGRYNCEQQLRLATLARMGAVCADYDLFGYGESGLQVGAKAHHTSVAHIVQAMNGLTVLDFLLARPDADPARVGVNGASGGGTQCILLGTLDDRITASCPVVSLSSWFDGGCPCESGMPIIRAGGGTCNAELAALVAPHPLCVVSDGKDWTSAVPKVEYPYLQRIYGFYDASDRVSNCHFPDEGHDFGPNKRQAVYRFFCEVFGLDETQCDESKATVEPFEKMYSFGPQGERLPTNAVRSLSELSPWFGTEAVRIPDE